MRSGESLRRIKEAREYEASELNRYRCGEEPLKKRPIFCEANGAWSKNTHRGSTRGSGNLITGSLIKSSRLREFVLLARHRVHIEIYGSIAFRIPRNALSGRPTFSPLLFFLLFFFFLPHSPAELHSRRASDDVGWFADDLDRIKSVTLIPVEPSNRIEHSKKKNVLMRLDF